MNGNYQNNAADGVEIDLIDIMFYLMRHWRSFLVAVVVGILFGCGLSALRRPSAETVPNIVEKYVPDERELKNMGMASEYQRLYDAQFAYKENSLMMQMNTDNVYEGKLRYYLSAGNDTEYINLLYQNIVNSEEVLSVLGKAAGLQCDDKYIKEILTCIVSRGEDFYVSNASESFLEDGNFVAQNVVIDYRITYDNSDDCAKMLDALSDEVEKLHEECLENYDDYDFRKVSSDVTPAVRPDILSSQKNCMDMLNTYQTNVERYEDAFSEDAMTYYEVEYLGKTVEQVAEEGETVAASAISGKVLIKWGIAGVFLFCICWGGALVLGYIFDKRIKTPGALEKIYHLSIIGRLSDLSIAKRGVDGWIQRLKNRYGALSDNMEYVACAIQALSKSSIVLCGNNGGFAGQLTESLAQKSVNVLEGGYIHQDKDALAKAKESDGIVMVVWLNDTTYDEIQRELSVCRAQNIPVLGVIVIGE